MDTFLEITVVDSQADNTSYKFKIGRNLLIEYSDCPTLPLLNQTGFLYDEFKKGKDFQGVVTMYSPIRYGDARINFD